MQDMPFAANDFCADDTPLWDEMGGDENTDILWSLMWENSI